MSIREGLKEEVVFHPAINREEAARRISDWCAKEGYDLYAPVSEMKYRTWSEAYGSTAGPFGGVGGQAVTAFEMEAWEWDGFGVVFCGDRVLHVGPLLVGARWRE